MHSPTDKRPSRWLLTGIVLALAGQVAMGHEFWLTVASTASASGQALPFVVGFGERFQNPAADVEMGELEVIVVDKGGRALRLAPPLQQARLGLWKGRFDSPTEPGFYTIGAALQGKALHYSAAEFQAYLTREQLTSALTFRKAMGEETRDARETVSMFAKCIVRVGPPGSTDAPRLRTRIELQPVSDPTVLRAGDTLHVRLFFNNGPQSAAPIVATGFLGDVPLPTVTGRTNSAGEADLVLPKAGVWLVRAVQIVPKTAHEGELTEWESYWASLFIRVTDR